MEAWLIYYKDAAKYNRKYIQFYIEEGAKLDINVTLILIEELEFGVSNNRWFIKYKNQEILHPDFAINRAIYPLLNRQLELMGIRVFNNSIVSEICNDKAKTYQYLAKTGIKMVDTCFYRNEQVKKALSNVNSPSVIKAVDGHGGSQVFFVEADRKPEEVNPISDMNSQEVSDAISNLEKPNISDIITGLGSSDVVLQPLVGCRHQDLRVYVIGKNIVAAVLRTAKEGFRSNYSLGGSVCLYTLSETEHDIVQTIINQFDFDMVGIDFIIGDEGELIFNEIEDVVGARMLYQCSDINIVELYLKYIKDEMISRT